MLFRSYTYTRACYAQLDIAHNLYFKAEAYMEAAEELEEGYTGSLQRSAETIRQRVYYYGRKIRAVLSKILYPQQK